MKIAHDALRIKYENLLRVSEFLQLDILYVCMYVYILYFYIYFLVFKQAGDIILYCQYNINKWSLRNILVRLAKSARN